MTATVAAAPSQQARRARGMKRVVAPDWAMKIQDASMTVSWSCSSRSTATTGSGRLRPTGASRASVAVEPQCPMCADIVIPVPFLHLEEHL